MMYITENSDILRRFYERKNQNNAIINISNVKVSIINTQCAYFS